MQTARGENDLPIGPMLTEYRIDGQLFTAVATTQHKPPPPARPFSTITWQSVCPQCEQPFTFTRKWRCYAPTQHGIRRCEPCLDKTRARNGRVPNKQANKAVLKFRETAPVPRTPEQFRLNAPTATANTRKRTGRVHVAQFVPRTAPPAADQTAAVASRKPRAPRPGGVFSD
jgi:hypothetical protein